jgi:hypothetical protein
MDDQKLVAALLVRRVALLLCGWSLACALTIAALRILKGVALCAMVARAAILVGRPGPFDNSD